MNENKTLDEDDIEFQQNENRLERELERAGKKAKLKKMMAASRFYKKEHIRLVGIECKSNKSSEKEFLIRRRQGEEESRLWKC